MNRAERLARIQAVLEMPPHAWRVDGTVTQWRSRIPLWKLTIQPLYGGYVRVIGTTSFERYCEAVQEILDIRQSLPRKLPASESQALGCHTDTPQFVLEHTKSASA